MSESDSREENLGKSGIYATHRRTYRSVAFKTWSVNGAREPVYNSHSDFTLDRFSGSVSDSEALVLRTLPMNQSTDKKRVMFERNNNNNRYNNGMTSVSLPTSALNTPNQSPFKTQGNLNGKLRKTRPLSDLFPKKFGFLKRFWVKRNSDVPTISDTEDALTVSDYGFDYGSYQDSPVRCTHFSTFSSRHSDIGYDLSVKPVDFGRRKTEEKVWRKRHSNTSDSRDLKFVDRKIGTAETDNLCFPSWIDGVEYLKIQLVSSHQYAICLY